MLVLLGLAIGPETRAESPVVPLAAQTTDWGSPDSGLQLRVSAPRAIEQRDSLGIFVELRGSSAPVQPDLRINTLNTQGASSLVFTNTVSGESVTIRAVDPLKSGPRTLVLNGDGRRAMAINENFRTEWRASFRLIDYDDRLPPGHYLAEARYEMPREQRPDPLSLSTSEPLSFWEGEAVSPRFPMEILPETPKQKTFLFPTRLRLTKRLGQVSDDPKAPVVPIPVVRFGEDFEAISLPVHNGNSIATVISTNNVRSYRSGALDPDDPDYRQDWYAYKGSDLEFEIDIAVGETKECGRRCYPTRVLWSKTLTIRVTEEELAVTPIDGMWTESERRSLSLSGPAVTDNTLATVARMKNLQAIDLTDTSITDDGLKHLQGLTDLRHLHLRGNGGITDAGMWSLRPLTRLESLDLSATKISDAGLANLGVFSQLRSLSASGTRITDAGLPTIAAWTQLEALTLSNTKVSDRGIFLLAPLANLGSLSLDGTEVTREGANALQRGLLNCYIRGAE